MNFPNTESVPYGAVYFDLQFSQTSRRQFVFTKGADSQPTSFPHKKAQGVLPLSTSPWTGHLVA